MLQNLQRARGLRPLHIYMNGDSTFRQQKNYLCNILQPGYMPEGPWPLGSTILHEKLETSCYNADLRLRVTFIDNSACDPDRLAFLARNDTDPESGQRNPPVWRPEGGSGDRGTQLVLYLNCGLHLLHLGSARRFVYLPQQYKYVDTIRNFSRAAAQLYGEHVPQVFMTSNHICEENFGGSYAKTLQRAAEDPAWMLAQCLAASNNTGVAGPYVGDLEALTTACTNGLFTGAATRKLRDRMRLAVSRLARDRLARERERERERGGEDEEAGSAGRHRLLAVVDAYRLTEGQCWASSRGDGRHYSLIVPSVVTELIHAVRRALT